MTTIALIMVLTASVASVMVKNGLGTCLTYGIKPNSTAAAGRFVITAPCNANDTKQNSWVITQVLNKTGNGNYTFCVNGTTLCSGLQKGFLGIGYNINLRLVTKDTTAPEQLWSPTNSTAFPNNFVRIKLFIFEIKIFN